MKEQRQKALEQEYSGYLDVMMLVGTGFMMFWLAVSVWLVNFDSRLAVLILWPGFSWCLWKISEGVFARLHMWEQSITERKYELRLTENSTQPIA